MTPEEKIEAWNLVDALRAPEGDSVTLLCDNPDGPPNNAIECNGDWTDWNDRRFSGETILECLREAHSAKIDAEQSRLYGGRGG